MAIDFPNSPTNGDTYTVGTKTWKYDSTKSAWEAYGSTTVTASTYTADAPPGAPAGGDLWYESDTGKFYIRYDSAWVELFGGTTVHDASVLTGDTLASNVVASSLTSVGTLSALSVGAYPDVKGFSQRGIVNCTSSTRPTVSVGTGTTIYETDTGHLLQYNGAAWRYLLVDGTYTPTTTNFAVGSDGAITTEWIYHGTVNRGILTLAFRIEMGTTGFTLPTGLMSFSLPSGFTADASYSASIPVGEVYYVDANSTDFFGNVLRGGAGLALYVKSVSGTYMTRTDTSGTVPFTWAASDAAYGQVVIRGLFS